MGLSSESIVLTTSYPSPTGIYKNMTTTQQTTLARDSGNVGIGTPTPATKLHVMGGMLTTQNTELAQGGGNVILAQGGGSVGIGTSNPTAKLHVAGGALTTQGTELARDSGHLHLFANNAGGRVMIGTTHPPKSGLDVRRMMNLQDPVNNVGVITFPMTPAVAFPNGLYIRADNDPFTYEASSERLFIGANGHVNIGDGSNPMPASPNGNSRNLSVNDVYLRGVGKWASSDAPTKVCAVMRLGYWYMATQVPSGWTVTTCRNYLIELNIIDQERYRLGCMFQNNFSWGAVANKFSIAPAPASNCGW